ncbi:flavin monoamine oxidase family protein [Oxalobacteraceae bacterium A2-2]
MSNPHSATATDLQHLPDNAPTRRDFLVKALALGGAGMLLATMKAWGMDIASRVSTPPLLQGSGKGKTVVVLGAGIAGMTAAYELGKAGYTVKLLEARDFAGGRIQTARRGKVLEELGGHKQVCEFDPGQYINLGPWRIPFNHYSTLHYTSEFNVALELFNNDNDAAYVYNENAAGPLNKTRLRMFEVKADMRGYVDELLAKSLKSGLMDEKVTPQDKQLLIDYLVNEGYLDKKDLSYKGTDGRGYKVNPGAGLSPGPGVASDPLGFSDLLQSKLGLMYKSVSTFLQQKTMFQPVGGMDMIAKAFEKRVARSISYNTEVTRLVNLKDKVEVHVRNTATGKASVVSGDYCLCTIPLSVLRGIENDFSPKFVQAMSGPTYSPLCKMGLQMKERFWETNHGIYGGHIFTDIAGINTISVPSTGYQSQKGTLLGYFSYGAEGAKMSARTPKERIEYALAAGEKIFPGEYRQAYEHGFSISWHLVKYNLGATSHWTPEAREAYYNTLWEGEGRTLLAGEHMSYLGGWMAGSIESAWQQIARIHQRLSAA